MSSKKTRNLNRVTYPASSPKQVPLELRVRAHYLKENIGEASFTVSDLNKQIETLKDRNLKEFTEGRV